MPFYSIFLALIIIPLINSFPSCINNENFCKKCNSLTNLCFKCQYDNLIPNAEGGCTGGKKCEVGANYCNECNIQGELCKICENGYIPDKNGGCSYTTNCKFSYNGECLECEDNYILIGKDLELKICKNLDIDDFKNCKEIDIQKGLCKKCEDSYFLNSGDKKCTKVENCKESVYGNCKSCNLGYYLNKKNNTCIYKMGDFLYCKQSLDGVNCDICDEMMYFDEKGICSKSNFCSESFYGNCQKCISNYYLSSTNKFCSIEKYCSYADKDTGICNLCQYNFYLDTKDYKCKSNQQENNFKYCQKVTNDQCLECIPGYTLSKDLKCTITYHCLEAENGKCLSCENEYHIGLDNKCINIDHCIYSSNYECKECEDNYYYNSLLRKCVEAVDNLKNCKNSQGYRCNESKNKFCLNYNDSTCIDNTQEAPYYKCKYTDYTSNYCARCIDNYYLGSEDNKCTLIQNCKISKDENTCIECDEYYCLDLKKGLCFVNDYIDDENFKFYYACNLTNKEGTACEKCIEGYEVGKDGYCVDVNRCLEKKEGDCIRCINEEYGFNYCANKIFGCVETGFENCLRCDDFLDISSCTECKEGYKLLSNGHCEKLEELV